jgi:hypothetical protein
MAVPPDTPLTLPQVAEVAEVEYRTLHNWVTGTALAAFCLSSGSLGTCQLTVAGPVNCANHGWTVAAGSNPSPSPFRNGYSAAVVSRGSSNQLSFCRVTDFGGSNCWAQPQSLAAFANPKVTSIP